MRARRLLACFFLLLVLPGLLALLGAGVVVARSPWMVVWAIDAVWSPPPDPSGAARVVSVPAGLSAAQIAVLLAEEGLVADPRAFRAAVRWLRIDSQLKPGQYRLSPGMTVSALALALQQGRDRLVRVTIPEGRRAEEVAEIIAATGVAAKADLVRLMAAGASPALRAERLPGSTLEGFLFPDTYLVPPDYGAAAFIDLLLSTFDRKVPSELRAQAAAQGLTFYQALILASIVEREAAVDEERPLIAGVFLNRLRDGLPLAADPTVQYALALDPTQQARFGWWKRDLTLDDLALASPYNTYQVPGLPPAPICNPGLASIEAVLRPQATEYRYFVALPDGTHAFAATFAEHQFNVARVRALAQP
ncbi:MAG: endolytic transglycosylase MltG [Chloroflexi bacterium]|nr:endolytic transglycosylase MltG [Chloroflexota bacterium]